MVDSSDYKPRGLEEICKTNGLCFVKELLGNKYCSLAFYRKIQCSYLGEQDPKNGLYLCRLADFDESYNQSSVQ